MQSQWSRCMQFPLRGTLSFSRRLGTNMSRWDGTTYSSVHTHTHALSLHYLYTIYCNIVGLSDAFCIVLCVFYYFFLKRVMELKANETSKIPSMWRRLSSIWRKHVKGEDMLLVEDTIEVPGHVGDHRVCSNICWCSPTASSSRWDLQHRTPHYVPWWTLWSPYSSKGARKRWMYPHSSLFGTAWPFTAHSVKLPPGSKPIQG